MDLGRIVSAIFAVIYLALGIGIVFIYPSSEAVIAFVALILIIASSLGMIWNREQWGGRGVGLAVFGISRYTPG